MRIKFRFIICCLSAYNKTWTSILLLISCLSLCWYFWYFHILLIWWLNLLIHKSWITNLKMIGLQKLSMTMHINRILRIWAIVWWSFRFVWLSFLTKYEMCCYFLRFNTIPLKFYLFSSAKGFYSIFWGIKYSWFIVVKSRYASPNAKWED